MLVSLQVNDHERVEGELLEHAAALLSQQVWCWGRDILRPEGNWLLEFGFDRIEPPANRKHCASVYALAMPRRRCVVLRGFGVFYGDGQWGWRLSASLRVSTSIYNTCDAGLSALVRCRSSEVERAD